MLSDPAATEKFAEEITKLILYVALTIAVIWWGVIKNVKKWFEDRRLNQSKKP